MIQSIEQGRKEDGNRSIADKIIKRLHDLDKTVENNQGRWAWELLQNAKDSIAEYENRTISVQIELDEDKVEFRHNGIHFTEQDVRGIINQISSKEIEEGIHSKKTGRFGTGFLTTHLLSKVVHVKGILETVDKKFYKFKFPLNREGKITLELIPKIEKAWEEFHKSAININSDYSEDNFNTSFSYHLDTIEQKQIAKIGVEEFAKLIPFVLAFIPKIDRVDIIDNTVEKNITFKNTQDKIDNLIIPITKIENGNETSVLILHSGDDRVAIASEVIKSEQGYSVKNIKDIPKLFCDFPLIGSDNFYFPVIVNSFFFNPQTERDGVWLKGKKDSEDKEVDENQELLCEAVRLFGNLISEISGKNFFDLYNISESRIPITNEKYFDEVWFKSEIQKPIREIIFNSKLVELEVDVPEKVEIKELWFPLKSYSDALQDKLWQFTYGLFPRAVCKREHLQSWCQLSWDEWNKLNHSEIISDVQKYSNIENLKTALRKDTEETFAWLNSFGKFISEDESILSLYENSQFIPNKYGDFKKRIDLFIDKVNDNVLLDILELLGNNWRNILLHDSVGFGSYHVKESKHIATEITEILKRPSVMGSDYVQAISLLSEWFENNPELGKELFAELHRKRAELFMNTIVDKESLYKVMRSKTDLAQLSKVAQAIDENPKLLDDLKKAEELSSLLMEFNVTDVMELKKMLILARDFTNDNPKLEITQDTLASLGVTSIGELEEALKDKDLASMFSHTSTPNVEMFLYAQGLISRAKKNIIKYLNERPDYDCTEMEELATTVIGGIKKSGLSIHVVIRPSDNGQVIVYYNSEKDTLDYENAELWIDDGTDTPRHLTLGKILKTTGIIKIPV